MRQSNNASTETTFVEFRRKVRDSELLALGVSQFSGKYVLPAVLALSYRTALFSNLVMKKVTLRVRTTTGLPDPGNR